jgi:hypothetical protein
LRRLGLYKLEFDVFSKNVFGYPCSTVHPGIIRSIFFDRLSEAEYE